LAHLKADSATVYLTVRTPRGGCWRCSQQQQQQQQQVQQTRWPTFIHVVHRRRNARAGWCLVTNGHASPRSLSDGDGRLGAFFYSTSIRSSIVIPRRTRLGSISRALDLQSTGCPAAALPSSDSGQVVHTCPAPLKLRPYGAIEIWVI